MTDCIKNKTFFFFRNFTGAFSDGAILFPLLATLSSVSNFSGTLLLLSSAVLYIGSGLFFKVPMSVQPLKAIAIAALSIGASQIEVRVSGCILGCFCIFLTVFKTNELAKKIPQSLIHCIQVALGVTLIIQGLQFAKTITWLNYGFFTQAFSNELLIFFISVTLVFLTQVLKFPFLGLCASLGMLWSIFWSDPTFHTLNNTKATNSLLRIDVILLLVLPQIALTLANSVIGTKDVVNRYYGKIKHRVEINNLLYSIGFGNIISALVGGLPFCHGSGGVTAHYRGGANHFISNLIMGVFLLFLAFIYLKNGQWLLNYPLPFTAILLIATGIFHLNLARPTWETKYGKIKLFLATCVAIFLFFHKTTH